MMTWSAEPFSPLVLQSAHIFLVKFCSVHVVARFLEKILVFFLKIFAFSLSEDAETRRPPSAPSDNNRELNTKFFLKLYSYKFSSTSPRIWPRCDPYSPDKYVLSKILSIRKLPQVGSHIPGLTN